MMRPFVIASLLLLVLLAGCGGSGVPNYQPLGTITDQNSDDWGALYGNGFYVLNNVWNKVHAAPGSSAQRVFFEDIQGETAFGWNWTWPTSPDVVAYPEVIMGMKPWDMADQPYTLDGSFPFKAGSKTVTADFDIRIQAEGQYNMAFSLWGVADYTKPKATISHEIMIWNVNHGNTPAGTHQGTVSVDGTTYDVYVNPNQVDHSGGTDATWTYIAFVAQQPVLHGPLHLSDFLTYMLNHGLITNDHYITSVELGNEIVGGTGMVEIRNYAVTVQ